MRNKAITLNSPIEFIIIGTMNNERVTLVKSQNAKIDLQSNLYLNIKFTIVQKYFNYKKIPMRVNSEKFISNKIKDNENKLPNNNFDRLDNLTFIWRSRQPLNKHEYFLIKEIFDRNILSIFKGYMKQDIEYVEYNVSDLIAYCIEKNERDKKNLISKLVLLTSVIIYSILIIILIINKIIT